MDESVIPQVPLRLAVRILLMGASAYESFTPEEMCGSMTRTFRTESGDPFYSRDRVLSAIESLHREQLLALDTVPSKGRVYRVTTKAKKFAHEHTRRNSGPTLKDISSQAA